MSVERVDTVTNTVQYAADILVYDCSELENFLKTFATVVHENHVILLHTKKILIELYGGRSGDGLLYAEMSNDQCKRKRKLCEEVIKA
jgi:hypothetical protein